MKVIVLSDSCLWISLVLADRTDTHYDTLSLWWYDMMIWWSPIGITMLSVCLSQSVMLCIVGLWLSCRVGVQG